MGKRRITIEVHDDIGDYEALENVLSVMACGKISKGAKGKDHYCWLTIDHRNIAVATKPKYNTDSDRFVVYQSKK